MERVQVLPSKCKLRALLAVLRLTITHFGQKGNANARITSSIYALAALVPSTDSYPTQR